MFDISLIDAGILPAMIIALVAGIFSFLSPCVLPIVPPYLAYMGGVSINDMSSQSSARRRAVARRCASSGIERSRSPEISTTAAAPSPVGQHMSVVLG